MNNIDVNRFEKESRDLVTSMLLDQAKTKQNKEKIVCLTDLVTACIGSKKFFTRTNYYLDGLKNDFVILSEKELFKKNINEIKFSNVVDLIRCSKLKLDDSVSELKKALPVESIDEKESIDEEKIVNEEELDEEEIVNVEKVNKDLDPGTVIKKYENMATTYLIALLVMYKIEVDVLCKTNGNRSKMTPKTISEILLSDYKNCDNQMQNDLILDDLKAIKGKNDCPIMPSSILANIHCFSHRIQVKNGGNTYSFYDAVYNSKNEAITEKSQKSYRLAYFNALRKLYGGRRGKRTLTNLLPKTLRVTLASEVMVQTYRETKVIETVRKITDSVVQNGNIFFDPCGGWANRYVGAYLTSSFDEIIINDANPELQEPYNEIQTFLDNNSKALVIKSPKTKFNFEPFEKISNFDRLLNGKQAFLVYTSPPYYNKELYKGNDSSHVLYTNANSWLNDFYKKMLGSIRDITMEGGFVSLTVADVTYKENKKMLCLDLVDVTNDIMEKELGFSLYEKSLYSKLSLKKVSEKNAANHVRKKNGETTLLYKKNSSIPSIINQNKVVNEILGQQNSIECKENLIQNKGKKRQLAIKKDKKKNKFQRENEGKVTEISNSDAEKKELKFQ